MSRKFKSQFCSTTIHFEVTGHFDTSAPNDTPNDPENYLTVKSTLYTLTTYRRGANFCLFHSKTTFL